MVWSKDWPQHCHLIKIHSYLSLDTYPKANNLSGKYLDIKTLHRDSETPCKNLAGLCKPSVQGANREAVEQRTAVPCAADPSFIFPSPSHLFPNPIFLLVSPFCNRTREKGLVTHTKQVQKRNWMHQQVYGAEATGPTSSFCSSCPSPLTSARHSVGSTRVR